MDLPNATKFEQNGIQGAQEALHKIRFNATKCEQTNNK